MSYNCQEVLVESKKLDADFFENANQDEHSLKNFDKKPSFNFTALYKLKNTMNQEKRRNIMLQDIKMRRNKTVDGKRLLTEIFENIDTEEECESEPMEVVKNQRFTKKKNLYANRLMMSEWFNEIPKDLENNWLTKLCPVGSRNLVIAQRKSTKAFNLRGHFQARFYSDLPGGNPHSSNYGTFTVLDCIYNRQTNSYYVLDVLAWSGYSLKDCDTEMRFYWLKSKLNENPQLKERNSLNEYPFFELDDSPAELSLIESKLASPLIINNEPVLLDGLLFYHRATIYVESYTPLVGWLKPYMIPEKLCIPVCQDFMIDKPANYVSLEEHLKKSKKKRSTEDNVSSMNQMECN